MSDYVLHEGDCLEVMRTLPDASVDAVVTDPPYALEFMGKEWDRHATPADYQSWCEAWARECYRVLKPGGHMLAFGGSRTYHRLVCGIEDAGLEIRDSLHWIYGSGFPKSLDVSKAIDKAAGAEREVVGPSPRHPGGPSPIYGAGMGEGKVTMLTAPATDAARQWEGFGTSLKPAHEPIVLARKPLVGTVAANVQAYGTGALNIDGARVGTGDDRIDGGNSHGLRSYGGYGSGVERPTGGRWPANLLLSHSPECVCVGTKEVSSNSHHPKARGSGGLGTSGHAGQSDLTERKPGAETVEAWECAEDCAVQEMDRQSGFRPSSGRHGESGSGLNKRHIYGATASRRGPTHFDTGGASRFFPVFRYEPKASTRERTLPDGTRSTHPTVKPLSLMRWLCRLITPPGGVILDPFAGSGSTIVAAQAEGFSAIGIEREAEYVAAARVRLDAHASQPHQPELMEEMP